MEENKDFKEIYNKVEILKNLKTEFIGKNCIFFDSITSTNLYANEIAMKAENGSIIIANKQTKGRGRFERKWISKENLGIYISIILKPEIELIKANQITLISAIALCKVMLKLGLDAYIKWPNDIILNGKKVSGILTEASTENESVRYIIVGIGINVNNDYIEEEIREKATSMYLSNSLNKKFNRVLVLKMFLEKFEKMYKQYIENFDFSIFLEEYKKLCLNLGKEVKILYQNKEILGKIIDITEDGKLIFLTNQNDKMMINSGEVSVRNIDGTYI